ncbi:hypothetical protein [Nesterenkonia sp. HG001]|uniref:hypothetical protein n=1 Tax=Nesterenkonia sp. HG001 TaxID=2983207 RepID=UPI002AC6D260|nr:hypothetical protein [Nesterenkonia sp. HG001]MDZ5076396.1 hypothetical protein [Nesterenkonia sp. HG001]
MTPVVLRRTAATCAALSGVVHLVLLGHGGLLMSLAMAAMAVVCLPCAGHLWRGESLRAWTMVAVMSVGMLILHLGLMRPNGAEAGNPDGLEVEVPHHGGGVELAEMHELLMHLALGLATTEVLLVLAAVCWHLRSLHRQGRGRAARVEETARSRPRRLQEKTTSSLQLSRTVK